MTYGHARILKSAASILLIIVMLLSVFCIFTVAEDDTVISYSGMNKTPGGTYGYLSIDDDDFAFNLDGRLTNTRFFGVSYSLLDGIPDESTCITIADELFNNGMNIIRFTDVYAAMIKPATGEFDEEKIESFDRIMYQLKRRGIYAELDFFTADALGATSLELFFNSSFSGKMQRFLKNFFNHTNDSGIKYYADEMITTIKLISGSTICIENEGDNNAAYTAELQARFNKWLLSVYTRRTALKMQWTHEDKICELGEDEDPEKGNVGIGYIGTAEHIITAETTDNAREADYLLFLASVQKEAYATLEAYIRKLGYRSSIILSDVSEGPLSTELSGLGDTSSTDIAYTAESGFDGLISEMLRGTITAKPYVVCFDTSADLPDMLKVLYEAVLVSSYQGHDSFIIGNYQPTETEGVYNVKYDSELWSQMGLLSTLFRHKLAAKAYYSVDYVYSASDTVFEGGMFGTVPALFSYISRIGTSYIDDTYAGDRDGVDLVITSGNTSGGTYSSLKTTGLLLQSFSDVEDAYFSGTDKRAWYNNHTEKNKMEEITLDGNTLHFGKMRIIASDGALTTVDNMATALNKLNANSGEGKERIIGAEFGYEDGILTSDSGKITVDTNNGTTRINSLSSAFLYGNIGSEGLGNNLISYYGNGSDIFVGARAIDGEIFENSLSLHIFGADSNGGNASGKLTFVRESVSCKAYALNSDGTKGAELKTNVGVNEEGKSVATVELDGSSRDYCVEFITNATSNVIESLGLEETRAGYVWPEIARPNLVLLIGIPALIFIIILYAGLKVSEKMKLKREEMLRIKTMEKSKTSLAAQSLAHGLSGAGDEDIARQIEEEKKQKPVIKGRNYLDDDDSVYDTNSMFNDSVWVGSPVCDSESFNWSDFKVEVPKTYTEEASTFDGTFTKIPAPDPIYFESDDDETVE